jgi:Pex14 N-terminal domain
MLSARRRATTQLKSWRPISHRSAEFHFGQSTRTAMADGDDQTSSQPKQPSTPSSSSSDVRDARSPENNTSSPVSQPENRAELIERARSFLASPQIRHEDLSAKRRFLAEKGLSDAEIAGLLQELVYIPSFSIPNFASNINVGVASSSAACPTTNLSSVSAFESA